MNFMNPVRRLQAWSPSPNTQAKWVLAAVLLWKLVKPVLVLCAILMAFSAWLLISLVAGTLRGR